MLGFDKGSFLFGSTCILLAVLSGAFLHTTSAESSSWTSSDLDLNLIKELASDAEIPSSVNNRGNRDCTKQEFLTQPSKPYLGSTLQPEKKESVCAINTSFGATNGRLLKRLGTNIAGKIDLPTNSNTNVLGTQYGKTMVLLDPSGAIYGGGEVALISNVSQKIRTKVNPNGTVTHSLRDQTPLYPKRMNGSAIYLGFETYSFSQNGKWLVADSPHEGHVRINLESGAALSFGTPFRYGNGSDPQPKTAISSDGRFAVVGSHQANYLKLYDLENCDQSRANRNNIAGCESRDLRNLLNAQLGAKNTYSHFRFISDSKISFLTTGTFDGSFEVKVRKYTLAINGSENPRFEYIGMGDSFASGEGADDYKEGTDTNDNKCHLSLNSFPYLIGDALDLNTYESVACSGAVIDDIVNISSDYDGQTVLERPQDTRDRSSVLSQFIPGELSQINFIGEYLPKNITVSIGGNNIGFGKKLLECIANPQDVATCFNTRAERQAVFKEIESKTPELRDTYADLKKEDSTIYVIAYPKIIKPGGQCGLNVRLNESETYFADSLTEVLNDAIETAAKQAGVVYVDTEDAFAGHRLCEIEDSQSAVHGLTEGNDRGIGSIKFLSADSYHPNKLGYRLYVASILEKTNRFNLKNPLPDSSATLSEPMDDSEFYNVQRTTSPAEFAITKMIDLAGISNPLAKQVSRHVSISGLENGLMPNSNFDIEIHSTPVSLGSTQTDSEGNIDTSITIPEGIEPGYHSLHFLGQTLTGESVDLYDYVYVYESENDFNGDQVPNNSERCLFVPSSMVDYDGDNKDDACDGMIGTKYVAPLSSNSEDDPSPSAPGIIQSVNNNQTPQSTQTGGTLQPQSSQAQNTVDNLQIVSNVNQDTNDSSNLLNNGLTSNSITVVSSPIATTGVTSTASPTIASASSLTPSSSSNNGLIIVFVVGFLLAAVLAYRKFATKKA